METQNIPTTSSAKKSAVLKWTFILGIAIVLNLFITYAVDVVYHQPQYDQICTQPQVIKEITTQEACLEVGGQWNPNMNVDGVLMPGETSSKYIPSGYCDQNFTCNKQFEELNNVYNRNLFVVFVIAGVISLVLSVLLSSAEAVSLGLSFGGVLSFIIGSTSYWSAMNDLLRVAILGIALAALIGLAYKKFKD